MRDDDALENNPHVSLEALEAIHGRVFGWSLSRCDYDHAAAEDLMQQAYVEVLSGRARFDNKSSLQTFVFGVVQNLARSRFRRQGIRLRLLKRHAAEQPVQASFTDHADTGEAIWRAVQALPARQRDVTELVFVRDLTVEQAAAVMGVTVGTARVHYDRAKKALAKRLKALGPDAG